MNVQISIKLIIAILTINVITEFSYCQNTDSLSWVQVKAQDKIDGYMSFLTLYPSSPYADDVHKRLFEKGILTGDGWQVLFEDVRVVKEVSIAGVVYKPMDEQSLVVMGVGISGSIPFNLEKIQIVDNNTDQSIILPKVVVDLGFLSGSKNSPYLQSVDYFLVSGDTSIPISKRYYLLVSVRKSAQTIKIIVPDNRNSSMVIKNNTD